MSTNIDKIINKKFTCYGLALKHVLDTIGYSNRELAEKIVEKGGNTASVERQISRYINTDRSPSAKKRLLYNRFLPVAIDQIGKEWVISRRDDVANRLIDSYESRVVDEGVSYTAQSQLIEFLQSRLKSLAKESLEIAQMLESLRKPS